MCNVLIRSSRSQSKRLLLSSSEIKAAVAGRNLLGESYLGGDDDAEDAAVPVNLLSYGGLPFDIDSRGWPVVRKKIA
jgi:hypothetical protein